MAENLLRSRWAQSKTAFNGWLTIPSPFCAELMAQQGWDSLTIDMQHGLIGYGDMLAMLQAIEGNQTTPLVRVPWNDPAHIMRALDAGAQGVIVPMVNTAEECARLVQACRYPPLGRRSVGPLRAQLYSGPNYIENADGTVLAFAMVETAEAVENLDAIMNVPGLDGVYIGTRDLAMALGQGHMPDRTDGVMFDVVKGILDAALHYGIRAGIHTASTGFARLMTDIGFHFVTVGVDSAILESGARQTIGTMRHGDQPASLGTIY